jgi:hypothetical protein
MFRPYYDHFQGKQRVNIKCVQIKGCMMKSVGMTTIINDCEISQTKCIFLRMSLPLYLKGLCISHMIVRKGTETCS